MRALFGSSCLALPIAMLAALGCAGRVRHARADDAGTITEGFDASVRRDVETLRAATARYRDLAAAEAAGYPTKMPRCVADSTMGGMGHHLVDRAAFDEKLDVEHPEMLIYAPAGNGNVELVAVEYAVPYRAVPPTARPPRLFGQELRRYDEYNYWSIHVWAWRKNAAGLFADWNPAIKC